MPTSEDAKRSGPSNLTGREKRRGMYRNVCALRIDAFALAMNRDVRKIDKRRDTSRGFYPLRSLSTD